MGPIIISDPVQINPPRNGDADHDECVFCDFNL